MPVSSQPRAPGRRSCRRSHGTRRCGRRDACSSASVSMLRSPGLTGSDGDCSPFMSGISNDGYRPSVYGTSAVPAPRPDAELHDAMPRQLRPRAIQSRRFYGRLRAWRELPAAHEGISMRDPSAAGPPSLLTPRCQEPTGILPCDSPDAEIVLAHDAGTQVALGRVLVALSAVAWSTGEFHQGRRGRCMDRAALARAPGRRSDVGLAGVASRSGRARGLEASSACRR